MDRVIEPSPRRLDHSQCVEDLGPAALAADLLVNLRRLQELIDGPLSVVGLTVGQSGDMSGARASLDSRGAVSAICRAAWATEAIVPGVRMSR